jgi:hypothetical protein
MYRTGDIAKWHKDGAIDFIGRNDLQIKIRGFRVEPAEIEARLEEHTGMRQAVVAVREDHGEKRLVAYYCSKPGENPTPDDLREHLGGKLPDYMLPAAYVRMELLPMTPNGKLDRAALPPPQFDMQLLRGYEPPVGEAEETVARIWADVLKLDRVGRHENFFELGGHSLLAVTVIDRLRRAGFAADVQTLFSAPTVVELAMAGEETFEIVL